MELPVIVNMEAQQVQCQNNLSMIDLYNLMMTFRNEMLTMKTELVVSINELKGDMEYVKAQVSTLGDRIEHCEMRLSKLEDDMDTKVRTIEQRLIESEAMNHTDFSPDLTVVAINLPDDGTIPNNQAKKMLQEGLNIQTPIVRAKRLQGRDGRPGIMEIQCATKEDKIQILRQKHTLKNKAPYNRTYLRTSLPHSELVAQSNLRILLDNIPGMKNNFRVTGNGRLITQNQQRTPESHTQGTPQPRQPVIY